jgi:hypothetical protein
VFISDGDVYCRVVFTYQTETYYTVSRWYLYHTGDVYRQWVFISNETYTVGWSGPLSDETFTVSECVISHGAFTVSVAIYLSDGDVYCISGVAISDGRRILSVGIYIRRRRLLYQWYLYQMETYTVSVYLYQTETFTVSVGIYISTGDVYCISDIYTTETFTVSVSIALSDRERLLYRWVSDRETFTVSGGYLLINK